MKFISKYIVVLISSLLCWCFFQFYYSYHLFHKEQIQLFIYSEDFILKYFESAGCLSNLQGDFLTQFLYLAGGGSIIIVSSLMLLGYLVYYSLSVILNKRLAFIFSFVFIIWELGRICLLTYPLSSTYSLIGGFCIFLIYNRFKSVSFRSIFAAPGIASGCWLFGYGVYFTVILIVLYEIKLREWKNLIGPAIIVLLLPLKSLSMPAWFGMPSFESERILAADNECYFGHLKKLEKITSKDTEANHMTYYYNLLNATRGTLPDSLMNYYQPTTLGLFLPIDKSSSYLSIMFANELWFKLGDMTMAEHCAMLSLIFSPKSTGARMIKRLAEINLINGDERAALKYLRILKKTLFYSDWAERRMPENNDREIKQWLSIRQDYIPKFDTIRTTVDVRLSLRQLLKSNSNNKIAYDYLLCYDLLQKDVNSFIMDYNPRSIPNRLYSEALLIYAAKKGLSVKKLLKYQISPAVIAEFNDYAKLYEKHHGNGYYLSEKYKKTYWFYFHYATLNNRQG